MLKTITDRYTQREKRLYAITSGIVYGMLLIGTILGKLGDSNFSLRNAGIAAVAFGVVIIGSVEFLRTRRIKNKMT